MDYIVLAGVKPYDGRYELDLSREMSSREWGWIKRLAGYLPVTMDENTFSDPEFACVLAVIALHRASKVETREVPAVFEKIADAPFGTTITIEGDNELEQEDDAGPPAGSPPTGEAGKSPSNGSSQPSTRPELSTSKTSSVIPV